ncbi:MAG: metallophosphoesterase [Salinisphaera sp.]|jgi:Icc protein|nr:metallophosphoesterase [Salinisphaera sp.]
MSRDLSVIHITDPHLLADPGACLHGWRVQQAFDLVLHAALTDYPAADALVLGGDLVHDESEAGYRRLGRQLAAIGLPVLAMAGNHDNPTLMAQCMPDVVVHGRLLFGDWQLIAINTHMNDSAAGKPDPADMTRLTQALADDQRLALIALHHPPWRLGSAWLDAIGLLQADALWQTLEGAPQVRGLICGHVHQAAQAYFAGIPAWSTPSTMRQFLPGATGFAEDPNADPGYRRLVLRRDGRIDSTVHRIAQATHNP